MSEPYEVDVVVVGFGFAGGVTAIEAHDSGASVLIVEKMPDPGGISVCSGGGVRCAADVDAAISYLTATCGGRSPPEVIRALAEGMVENPAYLERLAGAAGAEVVSSQAGSRAGGNYPLPGWDTFFSCSVDIPGFDARETYPHVRGMPNGARLFRVVERNVAARDIEVWLESPVAALLSDGAPGAAEVTGVAVDTAAGRREVRARRAVVLACGGFETDEETKRQFWQIAPVLPAMARQNTGDGLRFAQRLGARLWHMWHFHGSYGFRPPPEMFPYGIRMKRLPDWFPGDDPEAGAPMSWILVDRTGRRFMNEMPPYTQDTGARPMELYDPERQDFAYIPAHLICDDAARRLYPLGSICYNERGLDFAWSADNLAEVEAGLLKRADTLDELAALIGAPAETLRDTIERWNAACDTERDPEFGRPPGSFVPVRTPPFYTAEIWPIVSNTQGGPVHDAHQRIIDVEGRPIPRLYAAGELGSVFGHLYLSGGNLAECFVSGRIAGRGAAALAPLR